MYEFSVPQPIALFAYGHIDPNRDGRIRAVSDSSQASDGGSIPIARSITHDDSIGLAHLNCLNLAEKWPFLDPKWTPVDGPWRFAEKTGQSGEPTNLTGPSFAPSIALPRPSQPGHVSEPSPCNRILESKGLLENFAGGKKCESVSPHAQVPPNFPHSEEEENIYASPPAFDRNQVGPFCGDVCSLHSRGKVSVSDAPPFVRRVLADRLIDRCCAMRWTA